MTLQQLKYIITIAEKGSITEAAKELYISQPSLSNAIKEVEKEIQTTIFTRSHNGISLTKKGVEFLGYARQVTQQMSLLEFRYLDNETAKKSFSVSTQHYSFVADSFAELIKESDIERYEFILNETLTHRIIEDVKNRFSEIGIIFISNENKTFIEKMLSDNNLVFHELFSVKPHVFFGHNHPLASQNEISLTELEPYARINYIQGNYESTFYSEELFSSIPTNKSIKVSDSSAVMNLLIGMDSYIISSGMIPKHINYKKIVSVPLSESETMKIGYIICSDQELSDLGQLYVETLLKHTPKHI